MHSFWCQWGCSHCCWPFFNFYFFKSWIPTVQISRCACCCWSHTSSSTINPALAGQNAVGGRSVSTAWKMASMGLCRSATVLQVAFPYVRNPVGFLLITKKKKKTNSSKDKENVAWNAGLLLAAIPKSSMPVLSLLVTDETRNGKLAYTFPECPGAEITVWWANSPAVQ